MWPPRERAELSILPQRWQRLPSVLFSARWGRRSGLRGEEGVRGRGKDLDRGGACWYFGVSRTTVLATVTAVSASADNKLTCCSLPISISLSRSSLNSLDSITGKSVGREE